MKRKNSSAKVSSSTKASTWSTSPSTDGDQEQNKQFTPVILKLGPLKMLKHDDMFAVRQPEYQGNSPPVKHLKRLFHKDDKSQCEDSGFIGKRHNKMVETF